MKKTVPFAFLLLILLALAGLSCKSTPAGETPAEPPPPPPPAVEKPNLDGLNNAAAEAEAARKRAMDFESPAYFPSEWEAVDAQYMAAGNLPKSTEAETGQAIAAYKASADEFNKLFDRTVPLYAQAREDEIIELREQIIAAGFPAYFPGYLKEADEAALAALDLYEAKDYYAAKDAAEKVLERYSILKTGAEAVQARQDIINHDFIPYDPENFERAEAIGETALQDYDTGNIAAARSGAEEALLRYKLVLSTGWAAYAAKYHAAAGTERQAALDVKANVAVREAFNEAEAVYNQAAAALQAEQYQEAAALYTASAARFVTAKEAAAEKRRIAGEAIRDAEEKIEESDETAKQAEIIIEGGSR